MVAKFGSDPADILAVLGPSIRMCCYEVGETIDAEARERGFAEAMHVRDGRHYLDVQGIVETQLREAGIIPEHLEAMAHCTACENDRFYSYRADAQPTGRFAGVVMLKRP
jgi:copper oxidase (laccase) domain-containing protein